MQKDILLYYYYYYYHHHYYYYYTVSQKRGATLTVAITLSVLDRFAKLFDCCKAQ